MDPQDRTSLPAARRWPLIVISLLAVGCVSALSYYTYTQHQTINQLLLDRNYFLLEVASTTDTLADERATASSTIAALTYERDDLALRLADEENKNEDFERQLRSLAGTVGQLDKLAKTDEELLQKYSKVYFLSEHYVPARLKLIDKKYLAAGKTEQYFHAEALPYLTRMFEAAADDDIDLTVVSAFRSFETQADLKGAYLQTYGSGANTFSADQGYSEHQLGTTLDIGTTETGSSLTTSFETTEAFAWLEANAHKYGFVLSYPKGNAYYIYEPWHWRFVGEDLARDLKREDAHFYDWDQRKIDEYLIHLFD